MPNLIARELFFGNPDVIQVLISPDGKWISYIAPLEGVLNVWLAPFGHLKEAKPITQDKKRGIRSHGWIYNSTYLYYLQDEGGDENWRIHAVSIPDGVHRDLTPFSKTQAHIICHTSKNPDKLLVGLNNRDERYHDAYILDVPTGKLTEVFRNEEGYLECVADFDLKIRMVAKYNPDGSITYFECTSSGEIKKFIDISQEDTAASGPVGYTQFGNGFYFKDSTNRDTAALYRYDLKKGHRELIVSDDLTDVSRLLMDQHTWELQAACFYYDRQTWKVYDLDFQEDFDFFKKEFRGDFEVVSRTLDNQKWILVEWRDDGPSCYFLYDRPTMKLESLMVHRKDLLGKSLAQMRSLIISARDELKMVSYLTLPFEERADKPSHPLPMVLLVHGGPWHRDNWGFNPFHLFLANRGYAVLSVNFRSSTGFGKKFVNAGNLEWGRKIHEDLVDAVQWAIREKIADPARVAIMGGSFGGYASLVGLTFTPDLFACGVDIVGPSNLNTLLASIPAYWTAGLQTFYTRMGDPRTPEGKNLLEERSPLNHVEKIKKPLLIAQGANDPRVKQAEADQIVQAMKAKDIPVIYVLYPDEGHGFARPQNNLSFMAVTEAFLRKHLGGEAESVGKAFDGSSIQILEGKEIISNF